VYVIEQCSSAGEFTGTIAVPDSTSWLSGIAASTVHNCLYAAAHQSTQLHRVSLTSATHTVWYVPKWPAGLSVTPAEEILVCCVDKALILALCPLTGNRLPVLPVFELGITKPWHAVCMASGMLAVSATGPCPSVWLLGQDFSVKSWYGTFGTGTGQLRSRRCLLPWGIGPENENCVLVCDRENNRIVAIDFTRSMSRVLVSDICGPCGIAVDIANRSLFVGEWAGNKRVLTYTY